MKKTLLVTIDFPPQTGGVANYLINLAVNLPPEDLVVLAPRVPTNFDNQFKFRIYRRKLSWWLWPKWLPMVWQIYNFARKEQVKFLWAAQPLPVGTAVYLVSKILKLPYIVNTHGMDVEQAFFRPVRKLPLMKKIMRGGSTVTVNSEYTKKTVLQLGVDERRIVKVYPCPNGDNYKLPARIATQSVVGGRITNYELKEKLVNKYKLNGKKVLLTVGRLVGRKGHDVVLQALKKLREFFPQITYIIVGDGEYQGNLVRLTKELGLGETVVFTGRVSEEEVAAFYQLADVFVMPARNGERGDVEGFGTVFLEAAQYGKAVIAGNTGGQTEAVIHNQTGLVVDPLNVDAVANAIIGLLSQDDLREQLGRQGQERVKKDFNWETEAKKVEDILSN